MVNGSILSTGGQFLSASISSSLPAYSFQQQTNMGLYRSAGNTMAFTANGFILKLLSTAGAGIRGRFGIGTVANIPSVNLLDVQAAGANMTTVNCFNTTMSGSIRNVLQSNNGVCYDVYDDGVTGFTIGKLVDGTFNIGANSFSPLGKTNAITINQTNHTNIRNLIATTGTITNATTTTLTGTNVFITNVNGNPFHNVFTNTTSNLITGISPAVLVGSPVALQFSLSRVGRNVTLSTYSFVFDVTTPGPEIRIHLDNLLALTPLTANSLPANNLTDSLGRHYLSEATTFPGGGTTPVRYSIFMQGLGTITPFIILRKEDNWSSTINLVPAFSVTWVAGSSAI